MESIGEFTNLGDRVSAGGRCEIAVSSRNRCGWVNLRECGMLLYGRFPLQLKCSVNKNYIRPALMY